MTSKKEILLLNEILKLMNKYGPDVFESLAESLSKPSFKEAIIIILSTTAEAEKKHKILKKKTPTRKKPKENSKSWLIELEKKQPEKADNLITLNEKLIAKKALPTLKEIKSFVSDISPRPINAKSRDRAILPLLKILSTMQPDEMRKIIATIPTVIENDDRSLEGWSNIILERNRHSKDDK